VSPTIVKIENLKILTSPKWKWCVQDSSRQVEKISNYQTINFKLTKIILHILDLILYQIFQLFLISTQKCCICGGITVKQSL